MREGLGFKGWWEILPPGSQSGGAFFLVPWRQRLGNEIKTKAVGGREIRKEMEEVNETELPEPFLGGIQILLLPEPHSPAESLHSPMDGLIQAAVIVTTPHDG